MAKAALAGSVEAPTTAMVVAVSRMSRDSAMARAMSTALPDGTRQVSFDLKVNFINVARPGERLRATGRVLHAGHRTGVAECRVEGPGRTLVATATASFAISSEGES